MKASLALACTAHVSAVLLLLALSTSREVDAQATTCPAGCICSATVVNCNPSAVGGRAWLYNRTLPSPVGSQVLQLILTGNDITRLPAEQLRNATSLTRLDANRNRIKFLDVDSFRHQTALELLDLSDNNLRTLPLGVFANMTSLRTLLLDNNWLTSLPVSPIDPTDHVFSGLTLTRMTLKVNYLHCDCELAWLPNFITANTQVIEELDMVACAGPPAAQGVLLTGVEQATPPVPFLCSRPNVTSGPVASVVNTTATVSLTCEVSGSPNPEFGWYKDDAMVAIDYYRLDVARDGSLVIKDARVSDQGDYYCNVTSLEGSAASQAASLKVDTITCFNAAIDGNETDVDCGGHQCNPCVLKKSCLLDRDCVGDAVCLGSHTLTSTLLYMSPANDSYLTCAPTAEPGSSLLARIRASLRGRVNPLAAVNGTEDLATLTQELHGEIVTQLDVPRTYISNVRLEAQERHRRPLYKVRFSMAAGSGAAVTTKTSLERQLHRGQLRGTLAYPSSAEVQLVF